MTTEANPKVSVIMPCYNDGKYINEAVSSVRKQTYPNIELIIINDGSDDIRTLKALRELQDEGVVVIESGNLGPAGARNLGIKHASGQYILPLDSDDTIEPTYIEKAVKIIEQDETLGGVYCLARYFGKRHGRWELPAYSLEAMLLDNVVFITTIFRKSDWEKAGGFDESLIHGMEDYDFWLSMIEMGKHFYAIPEELFFYRIKKRSRTSRFLSNPENTNKTYEKIYSNHKEFFLQNHFTFAKVMRNVIIESSRRNYEFRRYIVIYRVIKKVHHVYRRIAGGIARRIIKLFPKNSGKKAKL